MGIAIDQTPGAAYAALARQHGWAGICDPTLAFRKPELSALYGVWRQSRGSQIAPRRSVMTPRVLKSQLPHLAIYEKVTLAGKDRRYRVRLMGTRFADVMGDMTGKFIDEAVAAEFLPRWYAALDAVTDSLAPLRFLSRSDTAGKQFLYGEFFEAPLLDDNGAPNLVLACGVYSPLKSWPVLLAEESQIA